MSGAYANFWPFYSLVRFFWLFLANANLESAIFFQNQKSHQARTLCTLFFTYYESKNSHLSRTTRLLVSEKTSYLPGYQCFTLIRFSRVSKVQVFCLQQFAEIFYLAVNYGNTGCQFFKGGIQNMKDFCLKMNIPEGILQIGLDVLNKT